MKNKLIIYYYLISIFLIANGAFSNFLFLNLHFSAWRQFIWIIGIYLMNQYSYSFNDFRLNQLMNKEKVSFLIVCLLSLITIITYNFNLMRITYSCWLYFSGLPYVIFPFFLNKCGWNDHKINRIFIFFGIFQTVGLLADYLSGGFFTLMFQVGDDSYSLLENGRYCFLAETPSTFGIYYSLCMVMTLKELIISKTSFKKMILFLVSISYIIGGWFTGSRQIVAVLVLVLLVAVWFLIKKDKKSQNILLIASVLLIFIAPKLESALYKQTAYNNRYSVESIKGDEREELWRKGFNYCIAEMNVKRIIMGEAVGFVSGQKAAKNEASGSHFENSYWARMSEIGLFGIWLFLLPLSILLRHFEKRNIFELLYLTFMLSFLFTSYVSPNGASPTAQMSIFIILGFFISEKDRVENI